MTVDDKATLLRAIETVEHGNARPEIPHWFVVVLLLMGGAGIFMFTQSMLGLGDVAAFAAHHYTTEIARWPTR